MKLTHLFGSASSRKESSRGRSKRATRNAGKSCSFGSSSSSSSASDGSVDVATPRTVLSAALAGRPSGSGVKRPAAAVIAAVTREELEVALRRIVSTEAELAEMLAEADAGLSLEEAADEGELRETFAVFDADGDGRISAEELRAVLASLGDERCSVEDCRRMIGGVDTDGDGFVCFDEFTRMMLHAL